MTRNTFGKLLIPAKKPVRHDNFVGKNLKTVMVHQMQELNTLYTQENIMYNVFLLEVNNV